MKKVLVTGLVALIQGCGVKYMPVFEGDTRPPEELAQYFTQNSATYFSHTAAYTVSLDGNWYHDQWLSPPTYIEPGEHQVVISHITINLPYGSPNNLRFPGNYIMKFHAKKGKLYSPMLNVGLGDEKMLLEACISEVDQAEGLNATRDADNFIVCSKATLDPYSRWDKLCKNEENYSWPTIFMERCTPESGHVLSEVYKPKKPF